MKKGMFFALAAMTQGRKTGRIELEYYDADDREALLQALEAIGRRN